MCYEVKPDCAVIEYSGTPTVDDVTGFALRSKLTYMNIVVAGGTIHRRTFEHSILVAAFAGNSGVLAFQLESELGMVNGSVPAFGSVAGGAVGAVTAVMLIVFGVAGITVLGNAFVDTVNVAGVAGDAGVFADQFESGKVVIELG